MRQPLFLSLAQIERAYFFTERQDRRWADGEFVYAHAQERFGQCQVCTEFAADAEMETL